MNISDENSLNNYGFYVGDAVRHVKDSSVSGIVTEIDRDHDLGGVTTCRVVWGGALEDALIADIEGQSIQWTNKLVLVD